MAAAAPRSSCGPSSLGCSGGTLGGCFADSLESQPFLNQTAVTPQITDPLPQDLADVFGRLVAELDETIPPRHLDRNLLVATWNLRAFGRVTEKWRSEEGDSPRRDLFDLRCIAEVVDREGVQSGRRSTLQPSRSAASADQPLAPARRSLGQDRRVCRAAESQRDG
jgi:hypothetical protein